MSYDDRTPHLALPLPHPRNKLRVDCPRVRESLQKLDAFAGETAAALVAQGETLVRQETALIQTAADATRDIQTEAAVRQTADAGHDASLAALRQQLEALAAQVADITVDPWDVFPVRVPVAVDGLRFGEGNNARHPIMPGETEPRLNWVVCDGGKDSAGGTVPDLRDRMILGASEGRPSGSAGGSETHAHSVVGTIGETTLTVAQMAAHGHTIALRDTGWGNQALVDAKSANRADAYKGALATSSVGTSTPHTHSLTVASGAAANLPPHYALTYIMRCA